MSYLFNNMDLEIADLKDNENMSDEDIELLLSLSHGVEIKEYNKPEGSTTIEQELIKYLPKDIVIYKIMEFLPKYKIEYYISKPEISDSDWNNEIFERNNKLIS